nr:MAG TPA: hypothetical protein [Caudoviricetes sp.]
MDERRLRRPARSLARCSSYIKVRLMRPGLTVWVSQATTNAEWPGGSVRHHRNHNPKERE